MTDPVAGDLRCGLCHDALAEPDQVRCPGCATLLHGECRAQLGRCPTLGCAEGAVASGPAPKPPDYTLFSERQIVWSGILASPAAAVTLLAINLTRVGRGRAAAVVSALVATILVAGAFGSSKPKPLILVLAVALVVGLGRFGRADIQRHERAGGLRATALVAIALAVGASTTYMVSVMALRWGLLTGVHTLLESRLETDDRPTVERLCGVALVLTGGEDTRALSVRAIVRQRDGRLEAALDDVQRALRLEPRDPGLLAQRGHLRASTGDLRVGLADLDQAIRLDPSVAWFHDTRRWVHELLAQPELALADAEEAARLEASADHLATVESLRAQVRGR